MMISIFNIRFAIGLGTATRLANAGFAVYGIDYEGHGKSAGLQAFVNNFDDVVDDCSNHFTSICGQILFSLSVNINKQTIIKKKNIKKKKTWLS